MKRRSQLAAAALAAIALAAAPAAADLESDVRRIVEDERARWGTPGIAVAVVDARGVRLALASGEADREAGTPMTADTQVPAASISKLFTAALVIRQVERGRLDLDAPVRRYLPDERFWIRDAAGAPSDASLRLLLSHHSGLPVAWGGISRGDAPVPTLEQHLARGQRALHAPRAHVVYANDGFSLAGWVAAQAEGERFAEHARRALLEPLGMRDSTFESPRTLTDGRLAAAYGGLMGGRRRAQHDDPTPNAPAGSLITTVNDLARFARMLLAGGELDGSRILRADSLAEMWRLQAKEDPALDEGFGLGFGVRERPGRKMVWWDGSLTGAANRLALLPEHGVGVVVLSNLTENAASSETADRILDLLVPPPPPPSYQPAAEDLARLAGSYRPVDVVPPELWYFGLAVAFHFTPRDGTLWQDSRITKASALVPLGPDRFRLVGSMLDGSDVLFRGDEVIVGYLRARRIPAWQTPAALAVYGAALALMLLAGLGWGVRRLLRRLRARR